MSALPNGALNCPVCGCTDTRKVSSVYRDGSWVSHSVSEGGTVGMAFDGPMFVGSTTSSKQTVGASRLAHALGPPPQPSYQGVHGCFWAIAIGLGVMGGLGTSVFGFGGFWSGVLILGVLGLVLMAAFSAAARVSADDQMPAWRAAVDKWQMLFFCARCEHVYNPQTRQYTPLEQMHRLILS